MPVRSLGYLRLESTDVDAWRPFGADFLGMMSCPGSNPESLYFRMDDYPPRLVVTPGEESRLAALGFEVLNERELVKLVAAVEQAGLKVASGSEAERQDRRVTGLAKFDDPGGNPVELFYGPVLDHVAASTPTVSRFVTGDMGFGHAIVTAEDARATFDFYTEVLGFVERNTLRIPTGTVWFLGCNARHHSLGVAPGPGPGRLGHFMVEAATIDDVGLALDRADRLGVPMMQGLGKHTNDRMVSFYVYAPDSYAVEFGFDGLRVEGEEPTYEITEGAFWGHKFTPPPA